MEVQFKFNFDCSQFVVMGNFGETESLSETIRGDELNKQFSFFEGTLVIRHFFFRSVVYECRVEATRE